MAATTATSPAPAPDVEPGSSARTDAALAPMVVEQLRHAHALQVGALQMFDGMLEAVRRERTMPEVADLLAKMLDAFEQHREETARHEREVRARLAALGARPARGKELAMRAGALRCVWRPAASAARTTAPTPATPMSSSIWRSRRITCSRRSPSAPATRRPRNWPASIAATTARWVRRSDATGRTC